MNAQEIAIKSVEKFGSQRKAALRSGVSQAAISDIISGKITDVKTSTITKLKNSLKQKVEQNKLEGKASLAGIEKEFSINATNFNRQQQTIFSEEFNSNPRIKEFNISFELAAIKIVCFPDIQIEDIKAYLSKLDIDIISYSEFFRLEK